MFFRKNKIYKMDPGQANSALQNIFAACEQAPNTIPFDKLLLRRKLNTRKYDILLCVIAFALSVTLLLPVIIVPLARSVEQITAPEPVTLLNDYLDNGRLFLELSGDGILYESTYLNTMDGQTLEPLSFDKKTKTIAFPFLEGEECNIYIPVENGQVLHLLISPE